MNAAQILPLEPQQTERVTSYVSPPVTAGCSRWPIVDRWGRLPDGRKYSLRAGWNHYHACDYADFTVHGADDIDLQINGPDAEAVLAFAKMLGAEVGP